MDEKQRERLKAATERKAQESERRSHAPDPQDSEVQGSAGAQDRVPPREKSSRHGQVTADKWNQ
jgi:hypothetical protein